jgi:hypothetical protein
MIDADTTTPPTPMLAYASGIHPPVDAKTADPGLFTRDASALVAFHGSTLPQRCVLCGKDGAHQPIKLTFSWDSSFKVTRISTLQLRQEAYVHAYLCVVHHGRWTSARRAGACGIALGVLLMLAGSALAVISESSDMPSYTPLGIALTLAGFALVICFLFYFTLRSRTLTCRKIEEGYLYLEGASEQFLIQLGQTEQPA